MEHSTVIKHKAASSRGQSFLELAIFLPILIMMISSLAEFGFLMNEYMNILDGPREIARAISYEESTEYTNTLWLRSLVSNKGVDSIYPVTIDPAKDDVIITIFRSTCSGSSCSVSQIYRYSLAVDLSYPGKTSRFTVAEVQSRINSTADAKPSSGIVVVELFYAYKQKLALPWVQMFGITGGLPDPIPVYTYSVMPLPAAGP